MNDPQVALTLKRFLLVEECPEAWKGLDLYIIRDDVVVFYVGQSRLAFARVWEHLLSGFKGHSIVGRFVWSNWPASMRFTIELLSSQSEQFKAIGHDVHAAEQLLIQQKSPCFNVTHNRQPTPIPPTYRPANARLRFRGGLRRLIYEAEQAVKLEDNRLLVESSMVNSDERVGWEQIWRSGNIPSRYRSLAAPNETVVAWSATLPAGSTVLDVGCGVGRHVTYLGGLGFPMAGVDISATGIQQTKAICTERGVVFDGRISDMTTLPWPDQAFAAALSTSTIHHHRRANIVQALAEVWRVLQPGGLFLVDFPCTDTIMYQELRRQVAAGEISEVEPNTFVDERPDSEDPDGFLPHHFCDEADLRDLLRAFDILKLEADLHEMQLDIGFGLVGKWVAWGQRPL